MTAVNPNRSYYPSLDGLRGVAILLVVFLHNFGFMNYFFFGWLGVDLFFVLSGFLITDILLKTLDKPNFLRNFYMRRILRIFPLFYLTLIIFLLIIPNIKVSPGYTVLYGKPILVLDLPAKLAFCFLRNLMVIKFCFIPGRWQ
ncbi:MAG: acyltransferase [Chitinophagaceae bacterium]|nr:acyltransferase [Chitinophagaceae bacterium]